MDKTGCSSCSAGRFGVAEETKRSSEAEGCALCPKGTYSGVLGLSSVQQCSRCPNGYYGAPQGSTEAKQCNACPIGKYDDGNSSLLYACDYCQKGFFNNEEGRGACFPCPRGRFGINEESVRYSQASGCAACPSGTYSSAVGLTSVGECILCPSGKFGAPNGSSTVQACSACPAGKYDNGNVTRTSLLTTCASCPKGKYNNEPGANKCEDCLAGTFGSSAGLKTENCSGSCLGGSYSRKAAEECSLCDQGKYSTPLTKGCRFCDSGRTSERGSSTCVCESRSFYHEVKGKCQPCSAGMECNAPGQQLATLQLQVGYWRLTPNSTQIFKCETAGCSGIPNATGDERCADGSHGPKCALCAKGFFRSSASQTSCSQCFEGSSGAAWVLSLYSFVSLSLFLSIISIPLCVCQSPSPPSPHLETISHAPPPSLPPRQRRVAPLWHRLRRGYARRSLVPQSPCPGRDPSSVSQWRADGRRHAPL